MKYKLKMSNGFNKTIEKPFVLASIQINGIVTVLFVAALAPGLTNGWNNKVWPGIVEGLYLMTRPSL